MVEMTVVKHIR